MRFLVILLLCGLILCSGFAGEEADQNEGEQYPNLLAAAGIQDAPQADNSMVKRKRAAEVHLELFSQIAQKKEKMLRLNLFDDVALDVQLKRQFKRSKSSYSWFGTIIGHKDGTFSLAVQDDVMVANVSIPPDRFYQIRYLGDGLHEVQEIDTAMLLPDAEPLVPEDESVSFGDESFPTAADDGSLVDIMVVYTPAARSAEGGTTAMEALINLAVDETNVAYEDSEIALRMRLVHTEEISYTESGSSQTDLNRLKNKTDEYMDSVHDLRDTYGADLVSLFAELTDGAAGIAKLMTSLTPTFESSAFSVVDWFYATGYYTFAHEVGHNMGCHHAVGDGSSPTQRGDGLFDYSHGWRFDGDGEIQYRTIMAYSPGTRIAYFSNPDVYYDGQPTGNVDLEDNARSIDEAAYTVTNFRESVVAPTAEDVDVITSVGTYINITLLASDDGQPDPPAILTYVIKSLPDYGSLSDPGGGLITEDDIPYSIIGNDDVVTYTPVPCYEGFDSFTYDANDGGTPPTGGSSNTATVTVEIPIPGPQVIYDTNFTGGLPAGWIIEDGYEDSNTWERANEGDPGARQSDYWTGDYMIVDSYEAHQVDMDESLITLSIDCSDYQTITLSFGHYFKRYSGNEIADVDIRVNGDQWQNLLIYEDDDEGYVEEDISSVAAGEADVQIRWHYYNANWDNYWGIDDVTIIGESPPLAPPVGDFEPDCDVDFGDYAIFAAAWLSSSIPPDANWNPDCDLVANDFIDAADLQIIANHWLEQAGP